MAMRLGMHLPQYGKAAGPDAITRVAIRAEQLGYSDLWVSDHVVHPAAQGYPSPYLYDPILTLTWAAACTRTIGLGTSVLVVPQHNPLWLAKTLASLDALSKGRLRLAVGVGWSEAEFAALGQSFHDRGRRTDEILDLLQVCWHDDPATFIGATYRFAELRVLPQPAHEIPIWVGAGSEPGFRRALDKGSGVHLIGLKPDQARPIVARIRAERPDPSFVISLRTGWDPQGMEARLISDELAQFTDAGIQYVVAAPWRRDADSWVRSAEMLAEVVGL
jgi:probable F420-dependent oxidoreductase